MSDDVARFGLVAEDGVSGPAGQAARELQKLQSSLDADTKSLTAMNKAMRNLKQATTPNQAQMTALQKQIDATKQSISAAQSKILDLGGSFKKTKPPEPKLVADWKAKLKDVADQAAKMPGPLGQMAGAASRFLSTLSVGRVVLLGTVAGLAALAAAAVVVVKRLTEMAIANQNARRNELLMLEAATKVRTLYSAAYGLATDKAKDLQTAVDEVSGSVSISRERVAQYMVQLEKLGVRGKNLRPALQAVATAGSISEEQGSMAAHWAAQVALVGGSVDKVAQRYKDRFGGIVQKQMLSLEVQQKKLAESQAALFGSVDIEGLLAAKKAWNDLFSQSTASGRIMRRWLGELLQPLVDGMTKATRFARSMVIEFLILGARIENKWLRFRLALRNGQEGIKNFFKTGIGQAKYFIVVFSPIVVMLGMVVSAIDAAVGLFRYLGKVISTIVNGGDWAELGTSLIDGIKEGVTDRKNIVFGALTGIGEEMLGDFRSVFGIESPSKVMANYGRAITDGLTKGLEDGKAAASASLTSVTPPEAAPELGRVAARGGVTIGTLNVTVGADAKPADATNVAQTIKRELEAILATVAVQIGAPAT